jgi:hypothetical protein
MGRCDVRDYLPVFYSLHDILKRSKFIRHCERSEAIQIFLYFNWIAASAYGLLAMTNLCSY